jgi:signal transduction histidine kinase
MVTMSVRGRGRLSTDWAVCLLAALVTASGSADRVARWLPHGAIVLLAAVQGAVLLARRRAPLPVLVVTAAVGAAMTAVGFPVGSASFATCCAAYAVAVRRPGEERTDDPAETVRGAAAVVVAAAAFTLAALAPGARSLPGVWGPLTVALLIASCWVLGYAIRTRRAYVAELEERAARLEAEQGARAARAVAEERLRIARELHDVIGHSISVITIQSEAAARSARTHPETVAECLGRISTASRQALAEMRHVLAVLRPDAEAELSPQPGLAQLAELVEWLRAGGLTVRLDLEAADLPPGLELTVYRIVQESLTNVLKHAGPGARAGVTVARSANALRVTVLDDGSGPPRPAMGGTQGIVGMRERVAVYGGTLRTGPRPGGGFEVEAVIPLPEEARWPSAF